MDAFFYFPSLNNIELAPARVAWVQVKDKDNNDEIATYYSYDIHGNVKSLLQRIPQLGNKRIDYVYDLVSGKVNFVMYQYGKADQFIHRYSYDSDNRIKEVHTSSDGFIWEKDASYKYSDNQAYRKLACHGLVN